MMTMVDDWLADYLLDAIQHSSDGFRPSEVADSYA